jgi:N-acetylmuramic acid 6-phosphate etherase
VKRTAAAPDSATTRRAEPATEAREPGFDDLDLRSTEQLVTLMNEADAAVPAAVAAAGPALATAIDAIVDRLAQGGRLIYAGAGTSGRLAALDAAECETTFSTPPGRVVALVAGDGLDSRLDEQTAEDDGAAGRDAALRARVSDTDAVVAISASGRTPWVVEALATAAGTGALTIAVVSTAGSELGALADHEVVVRVGPEILSGSTRLKAGTAQKLVLNMISTIAMIRLGKTYGDLMVDVAATNEKLDARVHRIVSQATGAPPEDVDEALAAADGAAKVAIVILAAGVDAAAARARLAAVDGNVRRALA